ncbi:MAG: iron ABC transporter permease [Epulopiscium sp.]|nr:iron ABC transporter permease [Candidatus Epulonipiscium sp.]
MSNRAKSGAVSINSKRKNVMFLLLLFVLLIIAVVISLWAGSYSTTFKDIIQGVFNKAPDDKINAVVRKVRLPRIFTALVAGAGLGVSGCILQAILNNPLASASTLGVSQGAVFGAAFAIIGLGANSLKHGSFLITICSFGASMGVALVIMGLAKLKQITPESIVLAGVAISSLFTGATTLLQYFADEVQLTSLVFWTFGDLGSTNWKQIRLMAIVVFIISIYFIIHRWDFNALLSGKETAISLGVNVKKTTIINMILCCFMASTVVSYIGLINFIGLVAPHMVRMVVGNNYVYLIPGSILAGSLLLLLGDLLSRMVISPVILPIGAITSFLGAPLFLYLLFRRGGNNA